jgi:hypothetical protein
LDYFEFIGLLIFSLTTDASWELIGLVCKLYYPPIAYLFASNKNLPVLSLPICHQARQPTHVATSSTSQHAGRFPFLILSILITPFYLSILQHMFINLASCALARELFDVLPLRHNLILWCSLKPLWFVWIYWIMRAGHSS